MAQSSSEQGLRLILAEMAYSASTAILLLDEVLRRCGELTSGLKAGSYAVRPDRDVVDKVQQALSHASILSRCAQGGSGWKAKPAEREFHVQRGREVRARLDGVDLGPLTNRSVRDSLEHIDEHVDRIFARRPDRTPRSAIVHNMFVSNIDWFAGGEIVNCRVLAADTATFHNLGVSVELRPLRDCLVQVSARLRPESGEGGAIYL